MRFAGERRFVGLQIDRLDQAQVRRNHVAGFKQHQVTWNQLGSIKRQALAAAPNIGQWHGHKTQRSKRAFGPVFLHGANNGIQNQDHQDRDGVHGLTDEAGNRCGSQQDQDHEIGELAKEHHQQRAPVTLGEHIRPGLRQTRGRLLGRQARTRVALEARNDLVRVSRRCQTTSISTG